MTKVKMDRDKANEIFLDGDSNPSISGDDEFVFLEVLTWLVRQYRVPVKINYLAEYYDDARRYKLAEKYYKIAAKHYYKADEGLGRLYYTGRVGEVDYEKAFKCYSNAADYGGEISAMILRADMYRDGLGVKQDYERYLTDIEGIWKAIHNSKDLWDRVPEVGIRLAKIRIHQGLLDEAIEIYEFCRTFLNERMVYNNYGENFVVMKEIVEMLYKLRPIDYDDLIIYDLFEILKEPHTVEMSLQGYECSVSLKDNGGEKVVEFIDDCGEKSYFHTVDEFLRFAKINGAFLMEYGTNVERIEVK